MGLLSGKVAIITGAGAGLGRAHALLFAREGAKLVINDLGGARDGTSSGTAAADNVVREIKELGGEAVASHDSVATYEGGRGVMKTALDAFGRVDILVNNAGILRDKTLLKMEEPMWDAVIQVHLKGTFIMSQLFAQHASERPGGGRIVNTTSVAGLRGNFGQSNYAAAKAGIYALTRVHSMELAKHGITVNAIAPVAKTRLTVDIEAVPDDWAPEQISPMVLYLASDLSKDVTGRIFGVHGRQIFEYRMEANQGVTKADSEWTAQEIAERLPDIGRFEATEGVPSRAAYASPATAPPVAMTPADKVKIAMPLLPQAFLPEKAAGWNAAIYFSIEGAQDYTLTVKDGQANLATGKGAGITCTVSLSAETIVGMLDGSIKGEQAFMAGKIKADNLADMMKFGKAFRMDPAQIKAALAGSAPAAATSAPAVDVKPLFAALPAVFQPEKAGGWNGRIYFDVPGAGHTVSVKDRQVSVTATKEEGLVATITTDAATLEGWLTGRVDSQKAASEGRLQVSNAAALVKFRQMFRLGPELLPKPAPPAPQGANRARLGHVYTAPAAFARPEWIRAYALATNDENPAYLDPSKGIVAPPIFPVRVVRDLLFEAMTDRELNLDLLRLVHGEQDMTFHRPIRPWDLLTPRAKVLSIEDKETGQLVTFGVNLYREGQLATEMKSVMFIRGEKKEGPKPAVEPPDRGKPVFSQTMKVSDDQPLRYADASGDSNPIHTDPSVAKAAGLPGNILQGLCTMAFTSQAVIRGLASGDPTRLRRLAVRFSRPVLPGDTLTTAIWPGESSGSYVFETKNQEGAKVITNGVAILVV